MNIIAIIIYAVLMPIALRYFFAKAREAKTEASQRMTDRRFIIRLPMNYFTLGIAGTILFASIMLVLTLSPNETSETSKPVAMIIFYAVFGGLVWLCVFLTMKTVRSKVYVDDERITVYSVLGKPYSFTFKEISSVLREEKYNRLKSELIEIKTTMGKVFVVDSAYVSYERFLRRIKSEVKGELTEGFE